MPYYIEHSPPPPYNSSTSSLSFTRSLDYYTANKKVNVVKPEKLEVLLLQWGHNLISFVVYWCIKHGNEQMTFNIHPLSDLVDLC